MPQAQIVSRPLTPGDITKYQLPAGTETSGGLQTVGIGQPVYLEADVDVAIPASDIVGVAWVLTNRPVGSLAQLTNSPLGTSVPVFEPTDQSLYRVAGRTLLRPDLAGQYTIVATLTTASEGTANLVLTITAGTYVGVNTCALCHSGGIVASNMLTSWQTTAHASIFTRGIDGSLGAQPLYTQSCLQCHTVGYDANTNVANGGFNAAAAQLGWRFPATITNGNWAAMPSALQNLANVQCESCHGPGSQHAFSLGNTNFISVSSGSGDCSQCHDAPAQYSETSEWYHSAHSTPTQDPTGPGQEGCVICHTGPGFIARISGAAVTNKDAR
jgi:mono/diheme cytochrome c family protein